MIVKDKCMSLKDIPMCTENYKVDDFTRSMLYNSYSVLNAADLYDMSFEHYLDNTKC